MGGHKSPEMITSLAKLFSVQLFSSVDEADNSSELVRILLGRTTPLHPAPAFILPSPWMDAIRMHIAPTTVGPVDVIVDASTVVVRFEGGVLHIAPTAGVICMEVYIEQLSDGSILISDNVGHPRSDNAPEFRGCVIGIDIVLGPTGDDKLHLDLVPNGALARNVTFATCFGDDVTDAYMRQATDAQTGN